MLSAILGVVFLLGAGVGFFFLFYSDVKRIRKSEARADLNAMNLQRIADALNRKD